MPRAILFDADGVIQEPRAPFLPTLHGMLGVQGSAAEALTREIFAAEAPCMRGNADFREVLDQALARAGSAARADSVLGAWFSLAVDDSCLALVQELRREGLVCCLATNQHAYRARYMSNELGYRSAFDREFYSCDLGQTKPHAEYFRHVLGALALEPHEVLFIDDSESNVLGARAAGLCATTFPRHTPFPRGEVLRRLIREHG